MFDVEQFDSLLNYQWHDMALKFLMSPASTRVIITGNQAGKTATAMLDAELRLLGIHPLKKRNNITKPIRCISKCIPKSDETDEENAQYTEFKLRFPPSLIRKDVTARSQMVIVTDPSGSEKKIEFLSKNMDLDAFMSVQRSALYQDEEIEKVKWDESQIRMLSTGGDSVFTLTPVKGFDWTYDHIWRKARNIYRSETICKKFNLPPHEYNPNGRDIDVFCWATDDNPILNVTDVDRIMQDVGGDEDEETLAMRRYGVFKQITGKIYKNLDLSIHRISFEKYFNRERFMDYWQFRIIDYHPTKPWYISWVSITPQQEWFVWNELILKHDQYTTRELRDIIKEKSLFPEDHMYNRRTYIDPLATVKLPKREGESRGYSISEELGMGLHGLKRIESADTKNQQGQMNVKHRLNNSLKCQHPFNNRISVDGLDEDPRLGPYLPTLWIMDSCPGHIEHLNNWRTTDYKTDQAKAIHDDKRITQKYSDFCRNLEFLGAANPIWFPIDGRKNEDDTAYGRPFQGGRR